MLPDIYGVRILKSQFATCGVISRQPSYSARLRCLWQLSSALPPEQQHELHRAPEKTAPPRTMQEPWHPVSAF